MKICVNLFNLRNLCSVFGCGFATAVPSVVNYYETIDFIPPFC